MSKFLAALFEPVTVRLASWYRGEVAKELAKYGLRYDDLLDPLHSLDVDEALKRLPQQEVDLRNQRLKRAIDISQKHSELPSDMQAKQTPFNFYLKPMVEKVEAENEERNQVGAGNPYDRSLP